MTSLLLSKAASADVTSGSGAVAGVVDVVVVDGGKSISDLTCAPIRLLSTTADAPSVDEDESCLIVVVFSSTNVSLVLGVVDSSI